MHDFAFALVIGVVSGTYSSVAAATLVMDWELSGRKRASAEARVAVKAGEVAPRKS